MIDWLSRFERIARKAGQLTQAPLLPAGSMHPFDERNIHPGFPQTVRHLFDDGHYAQATFEAYKFLDKTIQGHSGSKETGHKLMMQVFSVDKPLIQLTPLSNESEKDEQRGFQFIFGGAVLAIRDPRAHEYGVTDPLDKCLDHLSFASMLLRRLEEAGYT